MGNCVILKPSEKVPLTMMRIVELMVEAGIPKGVFQIVHGVANIVTAICDHPDIAAVSFVGSSKVAEIVANRCNALHKRVFISLHFISLWTGGWSGFNCLSLMIFQGSGSRRSEESPDSSAGLRLQDGC